MSWAAFLSNFAGARASDLPSAVLSIVAPSITECHRMSKTLSDLPQGRIFYCVTCDSFIEGLAGALGIRKYWEGGRTHIQQNPHHEVHDVFVDKKWHERVRDRERTT